MRKLLILLMAVGLVAGLWAVCYAEILGSAHDFSTLGWSTGQVCLPCHTPHNADDTVADSPLWNHEVTTTIFITYPSGGTMQSTPGQPSGASKLCLSCHDGTVALDSFGGNTGATFIGGEYNVGTDLSNDHPISITYDVALSTADGELFDPTTTSSGLGGTIAADMLFGASNDQLQCASCHDAHDSFNLDGLLRKSNASSALCLTCHDK